MESDDFAIKNANSKKICEVRKGMLPDNIPYGKSFDIICLFDVLNIFKMINYLYRLLINILIVMEKL